MRTRILASSSAVVLASLALHACDGAQPITLDATVAADASDGAADASVSDGAPQSDVADTRAQTLRYTAGPWMMAAGAERTADCESWTLHNDEPLYVSVVEMTATAGMHHSNWFFVPDNNFDGPDGTWRCSSRGFDQGAAAALGGVFFAQSTQVTTDAQRFPPGTAFVVPPHARIIGALHQLNTSSMARSVGLSLTVHTVPRSTVRTRLSPFYLEYGPLDIAPRARSQFDVECPLEERFRTVTGGPVDLRFFYGLAHYHEHGLSMRVTVQGGALDGRTLYETDAREGDSWARTMDPAVDISGATGLKLTCVFDNPGTTSIRYGNGNGEMCIWFGFTDSAYQWAARAPQSARNTRGETRDGTVYNTAPCSDIVALRSRYLNE